MSIFIQSLSLTTATAGAYSLNEAAVNTELCIFGYSTATASIEQYRPVHGLLFNVQLPMQLQASKMHWSVRVSRYVGQLKGNGQYYLYFSIFAIIVPYSPSLYILHRYLYYRYLFVQCAICNDDVLMLAPLRQLLTVPHCLPLYRITPPASGTM